jgi:hypothetical protein
VINPQSNGLLNPGTPASGVGSPLHGPSRSESCTRIKNLGFAAFRHIRMYGERFEIVSDPFDEGDYIAVHAISGNDPKIRTLRLPIAILVGRAGRFLKKETLSGQ